MVVIKEYRRKLPQMRQQSLSCNWNKKYQLLMVATRLAMNITQSLVNARSGLV
ncbi:predicted protein [Sclerotinia sclerotiorum 1980 UF-70]|uniref:Uncharacterized protein n=1 Tax=Sclerotinia sclerotiorum (strain ATCC 18683 / 1980 / Ss-1) TaxID=665079 RepID=A7E464_SCLS1|nr:predicted protein [Sclerotinia sclerotiorum 1980 UF-70]EDN90686.1 predicted protein [Sclerotinia sclerotiorum 1980 UF-70]